MYGVELVFTVTDPMTAPSPEVLRQSVLANGRDAAHRLQHVRAVRTPTGVHAVVMVATPDWAEAGALGAVLGAAVQRELTSLRYSGCRWWPPQAPDWSSI